MFVLLVCFFVFYVYSISNVYMYLFKSKSDSPVTSHLHFILSLVIKVAQ